MAKYRKRVFSVGPYFLGKRARSDAWCRCWYDHASRQVKRASLETTDEEEAKERLTAWFITQQAGPPSKGKAYSLEEVLTAYKEARDGQIASPHNVAVGKEYWLEHFGDAEAEAAAEADATAEFRDTLLEQGLAPAYVNRILGVGKAALMRAYKRRMIPHVPVVEMVRGVESEPRGRPMDVEELRALYRRIEAEHVRKLFVLGLGTGGRPAAMLQLDWRQVSDTAIRFNPPGRVQTKKRRPTVPVCAVLGTYLAAWRVGALDGPVVEFRGERVTSVKTAWRKARERSGLDAECNPYSLRHTVGRWLRAHSVPEWEVAALLGHRMKGSNVTEIYATADPAYMTASKAALDKLLLAVVGADPRACEKRVPTGLRIVG